VSVLSPTTLPGVNLWLDGWSGSRRCLTSQHDSPEDGFTLVGGRPTVVGFSQASVECAAPFSVDRIDVRCDPARRSLPGLLARQPELRRVALKGARRSPSAPPDLSA
jgi:hypothetical protein